MKTTISVTKEDIRRGKVKDTLNNPVALAIQRTLKRKDIRVHKMYYDFGGRVLLTPHLIYSFIFEWDLGYKVNPFTFDLEYP